MVLRPCRPFTPFSIVALWEVRRCNLQSTGSFSRVLTNMIDYYVFNEQVRKSQHMLVTHCTDLHHSLNQTCKENIWVSHCSFEKKKYLYKHRNNRSLNALFSKYLCSMFLLSIHISSLYALSLGLRKPFDMPSLFWQGCISSLGPLGVARVPEDVRVH